MFWGENKYKTEYKIDTATCIFYNLILAKRTFCSKNLSTPILHGVYQIFIVRSEISFKHYMMQQIKLSFVSNCLLGRILVGRIPQRFFIGMRSGNLAGQSNTVTFLSLNQPLVAFAVWMVTLSWRKIKSWP